MGDNALYNSNVAVVFSDTDLYFYDVGCWLIASLCYNNSAISTVYEEKKEEDWLSPMTKAPTPTEKSKKQGDTLKEVGPIPSF